MMRTVEVLMVIVLLMGMFIFASYYATLPTPRQTSPINLRRLALTTLQTLDADYDLSETVFKDADDPAWGQLQIALSALLPPNIVYNLTVYEVQGGSTTQLYLPIKSIFNSESLGIGSDSASYLSTSSNVTFNVTPEKIGARGDRGTLYILNCSDSNGWWITGYTVSSLTEDLYSLLTPYFQTTIMVQNTTQLAKILNGTSLQGEVLHGSVIINTFGEAVPIPSGYYASPGVGYDVNTGSYALYCYTLGKKVHEYNFTWVSIVGYPLYYVSNTALFPNEQNTWGIYGMKRVGPAGLNAFLKGMDDQPYSYNSSWITGEAGVVYLSSNASYYSNYYGIYPSPYQTSTRALPSSITNTYHLRITTYVFNPVNNLIPGAVFRHVIAEDTNITGSLFALGLTQTPDIRLAAIGLLTDYKPRLYRSEYTATGRTSRLVVLQLGLVGGA